MHFILARTWTCWLRMIEIYNLCPLRSPSIRFHCPPRPSRGRLNATFYAQRSIASTCVIESDTKRILGLPCTQIGDSMFDTHEDFNATKVGTAHAREVCC